MLRNIEAITKDADNVTREQAIAELNREIEIRVGTTKKPGGVYTRWANAEPGAITKHQAYERQTARMIALLHVLEMMEDKDWARMQLRWKTLTIQLAAQTSLFQ
ncbi:MAG: hypothetical protein K9J37_19680 [Saprospiraceae bacterium]|nr:hypothetical protein [Saprospiraceae bacterium]MCF8252147.1 hypothetical protein [Saprospiraceae bacterium]MCF8282444.1 hypothetical protein [Bacteroidales bacterium]MCF8313816.1 hypothetical protein [Saprospiraceae bacterium]MCF8442522.1 hypothetical protein [Saprospiraceae bacterium]